MCILARFSKLSVVCLVLSGPKGTSFFSCSRYSRSLARLQTHKRRPSQQTSTSEAAPSHKERLLKVTRFTPESRSSGAVEKTRSIEIMLGSLQVLVSDMTLSLIMRYGVCGGFEALQTFAVCTCSEHPGLPGTALRVTESGISSLSITTRGVFFLSRKHIQVCNQSHFIKVKRTNGWQLPNKQNFGPQDRHHIHPTLICKPTSEWKC